MQCSMAVRFGGASFAQVLNTIHHQILQPGLFTESRSLECCNRGRRHGIYCGRKCRCDNLSVRCIFICISTSTPQCLTFAYWEILKLVYVPATVTSQCAKVPAHVGEFPSRSRRAKTCKGRMQRTTSWKKNRTFNIRCVASPSSKSAFLEP
ncbi:hypothetical protein K474DRAFT_716418 [Panus rudis PR-1116 ss-1]|nr:hypothetical protein K474DRAFT_716418 [Panus rudis PR-1116 ss-1]